MTKNKDYIDVYIFIGLIITVSLIMGMVIGEVWTIKNIQPLDAYHVCVPAWNNIVYEYK